jgi:hypothetical protein
MTTTQPPSGVVDLAASEYPVAFLAAAGNGKAVTGASGSWSHRAEVMGLGGFQKEALVEDLATGRVWRLAADEGKYLRGTGLAPAPLMHWAAGLHGDVTARVAGRLKDEGIDFSRLHMTISQGFASEGSFVKGEAIARVYDLRIAADVAGCAADDDLSPVIERALTASPAIAAMLNAAEGAFALFVNGRGTPVEGVPQSTGQAQADPFLRHSRQPRPVPGLPLNPGLQTVRPPLDGGTVFSDDQAGAIGWRVEAYGSYDLDTGLVESTVHFPGVGVAESWNLISDASNEAAPSGLALFTVGAAFCYHTQLCRYADVRRMAIDRPRLVQVSNFSSNDRGQADAVDTQLFLNGSLDSDAATTLLTAAKNTCYAHRALGVTIERPKAVVTQSRSGA